MKTQILKDQFEIAAGSVIGRDHLRLGRNNQDAYGYVLNERMAIALVCDGCGSGAHSEVGAKLGNRLFTQILTYKLGQPNVWKEGLSEEFWTLVYKDFLAELRSVAIALGDHLPSIIQDYLLFTLVGAVMTPEATTLFSIGDGVIAVNGKVKRLGPFPGNAPPYPAYGLLPEFPLERSQVVVHHQLPTREVQSLLVGTDGVGDLLNAATQSLPGKPEPVGAIAQFWEEDAYFQNPDQVRRRLFLVNREVTRLDRITSRLSRETGLLSDDTTLVVMRRRERE